MRFKRSMKGRKKKSRELRFESRHHFFIDLFRKEEPCVHNKSGIGHHPIPGFYPRGTLGRDYDHRHFDRAVAARGAGGAGIGETNSVRKQSQANRSGLHHPRTRERFLSLGRLGLYWVGDPDLGVGKRQPGGWIYSILPYIEQKPLYDLGSGASLMNFGDSLRLAANAKRIQQPLAVFNCPTRRQSVVFGLGYAGTLYVNLSLVTGQARSDYAANVGDISETVSWTCPGSYPSPATTIGMLLNGRSLAES